MCWRGLGGGEKGLFWARGKTQAQHTDTSSLAAHILEPRSKCPLGTGRLLPLGPLNGREGHTQKGAFKTLKMSHTEKPHGIKACVLSWSTLPNKDPSASEGIVKGAELRPSLSLLQSGLRRPWAGLRYFLGTAFSFLGSLSFGALGFLHPRLADEPLPVVGLERDRHKLASGQPAPGERDHDVALETCLPPLAPGPQDSQQAPGE